MDCTLEGVLEVPWAFWSIPLSSDDASDNVGVGSEEEDSVELPKGCGLEAEFPGPRMEAGMVKEDCADGIPSRYGGGERSSGNSLGALDGSTTGACPGLWNGVANWGPPACMSLSLESPDATLWCS